MNISVSYYSSIGGRKKNEDTVFMSESCENLIGMVADGLGGHENGELASKLAIKTINMEIMHKTVSIPALRDAVEKANEQIVYNADHSSMKSTIAAVWMDEHCVLAVNVGDTRIYQFREKEIIYQSVDHSVAEISYLAGDISKEEIRTSKERHKLTRALGGQKDVKADIVPLKLRRGDALLLCSDGFWEKIKESEMLNDLSGIMDAGIWLSRMKNRIKENHDLEKGDNHSAIAIIVM